MPRAACRPAPATAALFVLVAIALVSLNAARRGLVGAPVALISTTGHVRGFVPSDLPAGSGIVQQMRQVILSPTGLAGWPDAGPRDGDWCEIDGAFHAIESGVAIKMQNVTVRYELKVKG